MRRLLAISTVLLFMFAQVPAIMAQAVTFPTLYDDFNAFRIDPNRWRGITAALGYETVVAQVFGRLHIALQAYGNIGAGPDNPITGRVRFMMQDAAAVAASGVQVTTRVDAYELTSCGSVTPGNLFARLVANLFRDGTNPNPSNPDDLTGIVDAGIGVAPFTTLPRDVLRVSFFAERCGDSDCSDATLTDLGGGSFQNAHTGQDVTLGIELDTVNHRIIFTKDNETLQAVPYPADYTVNIASEPRLEKGVVVRHRLETCPIRTKGFMEATFNNFRTKP